MADDGLDRLAALVAARMGLYFPVSRQKDLRRAAEALAREEGAKATEACLQALAAAPLSDRQIEILTAHLTVVETYFFREMKSLDAFRNHVIPELLRQRAGVDQRLRIWSAGCSTGEEAYSIAMLLTELIPDMNAWDVHILATDINPQALEKARRGVYTEWSFRGMPQPVRGRYFQPHGLKTFAVRPRFKEMVSFACLNLATEAFPSLQNGTNAMDVIFCRNVMMYLVPELIQKVIGSFHHCLVEGGWLIVAPSESALLHSSGFASVAFDGATLYRKSRPKPAVVKVWTQTLPTGTAPAREDGNVISLAAPFTPPPCESRGNAAPASSVSQPADPYEDALTAYHAGRYDEAAATLQNLFGAGAAREPAPGAAGQAFALMARVDANLGKLEQAAEWSQKAIAADKVNPRFYYLLATILDEQHRPADAEQTLKRALYLDSAFVLAHYTLGMIALREHGRNASERHFRNAAALLARLTQNEVLPESEGLTAGRLLEIIETIMGKEGIPP
jgi:chemotaxis protein methyltransferase CheR